MKLYFKRKDIFTIPNALSLFRLLLIPWMLWLYRERQQYIATILVLLLSGLTDIADGKIARRFHMVTDFGKILDPVADKLTQAALLLCLLERHPQLRGLLILFVIRELLLALFGYAVLVATGVAHGSKWYGKLCTVLIYGSLAAMLLFPALPEPLVMGLTVCCTAAVLLSCTLYCRFYIWLLRKPKLSPELEPPEEK